MSDNKCLECGRKLPKKHTRCLPCDDLRYQAESENPIVAPPSNLSFSQSLGEIAENRKARKAEIKKAKLDSAFAWGSAIGEQEISEDYSYKSLPDSFCSECGLKLASASNFCTSCGKKRNGTDLSGSVTNQSLYPNRKKSKSSVWVVLLILLVLAGVGYGVYANILSNGSSDNSPQDYDVNSVDTNSREYVTGLTIGDNFSGFSDAGAIAEEVCATARDRRIVLSSQGGIGVDPKTATFLNSEDGFQGCIDGFNGVPQD